MIKQRIHQSLLNANAQAGTNDLDINEILGTSYRIILS